MGALHHLYSRGILDETAIGAALASDLRRITTTIRNQTCQGPVVHQITKPRGDASSEISFMKSECAQAGKGANSIGNGATETIRVELKELQFTEHANACDIARQEIIVQIQLSQVHQVVKRFGKGPGQLIEVKINKDELFELSHLAWNGTS